MPETLSTGWIPGGPDLPVEVDLTDHADLIASYRAAQRDRDRAEEEMSFLRELIEKLLPDDPPEGGVIVRVHGQVAVTRVPHGARQVNLAMLRHRYPEIAARCECWSIRRPFRVLKADDQ